MTRIPGISNEVRSEKLPFHALDCIVAAVANLFRLTAARIAVVFNRHVPGLHGGDSPVLFHEIPRGRYENFGVDH